MVGIGSRFRTFYPSAVDARQANILHVGEGAEVSGIDVLVRPDATRRISGRVVIAGQGPVAFGYYLLPADPTALTDDIIKYFPNSSSNQANGKFELRGILPCNYPG